MSTDPKRIVPVSISASEGEFDFPVGSLHEVGETGQQFFHRKMCVWGTEEISELSTEEIDDVQDVVVIEECGCYDVGTRNKKLIRRHDAVTKNDSIDERDMVVVKMAPKRKGDFAVANDFDVPAFDLEEDDEEELVQLEPITPKPYFGVTMNPLTQPNSNGQGKKVQRVCITWNNPTITGADFKTFLEEKGDVKFAVFQEEVGENGTRHFQGYIESTKRMYTTGWQSMLAPHKMSVLHCKGTKLQNHTYCTKEGRTNGPWYVKSSPDDYKRKSGKQGDRSDIDDFAKLVEENGGINENVREEMSGHALRFGKQAQQYVGDINRERAKKEKLEYWREQVRLRSEGLALAGQKPRELVLLFGPTAVGKTTEAMLACVEKYEDLPYEKMGGCKWWDNYKQEQGVLVDEWRKDMASMEEFNNLTNAGASNIEVKGGSDVLIAKTLWFTSNRHPMDIFGCNKKDARYQAMARRFSEVHWWKTDKESLVVLKNPGIRPENPSEEWLEQYQDWKHFWNFRDIPLQEGDSFDTEAFNYFEW